MESADWYSHIRVKYCDKCREVVNREQTAARMAKYRRNLKEENKEQKVRIKCLELENESLRERLKLLVGVEVGAE